jgi:GNAT superfamily N-acetyltransferase
MASTAAGQLARLTHLKVAVSAAYPALASSRARLAAMGYVIADLPVADIDRLEGLWRELLDHHLAAAPHLTALGIARDPADSWRVRRAQYIQWLSVPRAAVLVARDSDRLLGYAMIRATDAAGSWQWGDQVGTLETLVVAGSARGTGAGRELLDAARERVAEWGAQVMTISVIAGNERAERFYRREGASDYLHTLILPVRQPLPPCHCARGSGRVIPSGKSIRPWSSMRRWAMREPCGRAPTGRRSGRARWDRLRAADALRVRGPGSCGVVLVARVHEQHERVDQLVL